MIHFSDCSWKMVRYHFYGWVLYTLLFYGVNQLNEKPPSLLAILAVLPLMAVVFYGILAILTYASKEEGKLISIGKGGIMVALFACLIPMITYGYLYGLLRLLGVDVQTKGTTFSISEFMKNNALGFVRYSVYAFVYFAVGRLLKAQRAYYEARQEIMRQEIELLAAKNEKLEYELTALQMQLSPHIQHSLFNKLYGRALRADELLPNAILQMADITAYATQATEPEKALVPVELELKILAKLAVLTAHTPVAKMIKQLLSGDQLDGQLVPRLSLVTLFENAVKFSRSKDERHPITVEVAATPEHLEFKCVNKIGAASHHEKSLGTGLVNLKRRLHILFRHCASLHTYSENGFYHARLEIRYT